MAASDAFVNQDTATMDQTALVCNRTCLKASQTDLIVPCTNPYRDFENII